MNRQEHLLAIAEEECGEVGQRFSKALRFGEMEIQPGQNLTNRQRVLFEFADLYAVMQMLGFFPFGIGDSLDSLVAAKKEKVERFLAYSVQCGTLDVAAARPEGPAQETT